MGSLAGCGGGKTLEEQSASQDNASAETETDSKEFSDGGCERSRRNRNFFWHSMGGVNGQAIDTLVKKFNSENEYGITVNAQYQGEYDDSLNKLKSAQIGNMGAVSGSGV